MERWVAIAWSEEGGGGASWKPRMRLLRGMPVASARRMMCPGDESEEEGGGW